MIRPHYVPLYQSVCTSEKLADLASDAHRLFYVLLLTHADSWGRCKGSARVLTAMVWPLLGKKPADTEKALADLDRVGLIQRYEVGGDQFLAIPDWEDKAGKVGKVERRAASIHPVPPPDNRTCASRRTSPATSPEPQDYSCDNSDAAGLVLSRARAITEPSYSRAEPSQAEPSREFPADAGTAREPVTSGASARPRAEPSGSHAEVIRWFSDRFLAVTGKPYAVEGGKDGKAVKALLAHAGAAGVPEIRERGERFFANPWQRNQGGLSLSKFAGRWNDYAGTGALQRAESLSRYPDMGATP